MTTHHFPIRRLPLSAERQRTNGDAGRSAPAPPSTVGRSTFSAAKPGGPEKARQSNSPRTARGTYPSRAGLAAAICVSWTIALVVGVVLAMEIFG